MRRVKYWKGDWQRKAKADSSEERFHLLAMYACTYIDLAGKGRDEV
jgi:hypothetical protein